MYAFTHSSRIPHRGYTPYVRSYIHRSPLRRSLHNVPPKSPKSHPLSNLRVTSGRTSTLIKMRLFLPSAPLQPSDSLRSSFAVSTPHSFRTMLRHSSSLHSSVVLLSKSSYHPSREVLAAHLVLHALRSRSSSSLSF